MHHVPAQVGLPVIQRSSLYHRVHLFEEFGFGYIHHLRGRSTNSCQVNVPIKVGTQGCEVFGFEFVIDLVRVATADPIQGAFGESGFDIHYRFSFCRCFGGSVAQQFKHFLDMVYVLLAQFHGLGIIFDVVIAVGKCHSSLIGFCDGLGRILEILIGGESEHGTDGLAV